jgi:hypothetical protein
MRPLYAEAETAAAGICRLNDGEYILAVGERLFLTAADAIICAKSGGKASEAAVKLG